MAIGYSTPENLQNYARYLDSRIKAYGHLKHDAIRVQADTNRDMRNSAVIEDSSMRRRGASAPPGPARSKTITGRKLRSMTVEKGLLRETKAVHRMIDALIECRVNPLFIHILVPGLIVRRSFTWMTSKTNSQSRHYACW
jgi:hypothetical protein